MRDIKFRAWLKDEETMVDVEMIDWNGKFIVHRDLTETHVYTTELEPLDPKCITDFKDCILLQFTGLLDAKGKEVYEDDIIRSTWNHRIYEVKWEDLEGEWCFCSDCGTTKGKYAGAEVIGNCYESPELLTPNNKI